MKVLTKNDLVFDKALYEKCLVSFRLAEDYLGLKLHVHAEENQLADGQIFLFNHYARFETVIPVYIFYQELRAFTRTIADHQLFESNKKLRKILCGAGAVPNNLPGLLPFLAAELLKGRKVSIFPEGAMMKSRQVMNEEQQFMVFSPSKQTFRKHHTGAAVLALTLDLFKRRINSLFEKGDTERLNHWRDALEFSNHEELKASIGKPTLIVPGTITFSPLRIGGNFLSNALKLLNRDVSEKVLEEVIIEGNILLKNTDMDIRFGKPIQAHQQWTWWEAWLIDNYFLSIRSLEEFFSLREQEQTWSTRLLTAILYKKTTRIRDEYIRGLYSGITINTGHVGACLVYAHFNRGDREVPKKAFHHALYYTVKELQRVPDIHLIYRLSKPENYRYLYLGQSPTFMEWLDIAVRAGLLKVQEDCYVLLDKLGHDHGFHEIRLENPLLVSANEVAAVPAVNTAIAKAMDKAASHDPMYFSTQLWDDELRAYAWEAEKFNREEYREINRLETATEERGPYLLTHNDATRTGILLVHGFLSSPAELSAYGNHIYELGFNVLGVRLAGHGTSPCDLATRSWNDWLESVRHSYEILSAISTGVILVGFSVGGTLALLLAAMDKPDNLKGVAGICSALKVRDNKLKYAPLAHAFSRVSGHFRTGSLAMNYRLTNTGQPTTNYQSMPISALVELRKVMAIANDRLQDIEGPLLVVQSRMDTIVDSESAEQIIEKSAAKNRELVWIETDNHYILRENTLNTWDVLDGFIRKHQ
jgi:esterase/lipase